MKISQKLILVCSIPMLAFLLVSALYLQTWWQQAQDLNEVKQNIRIFARISGLIHETQKERGLTAIFLSNGNKIDVDKQHPQTNAALASLIQSVSKAALPPGLQAALGTVEKTLSQCRSTVTSNSKQAFTAYTDYIRSLQQVQGTIVRLKDAGFHLQQALLSAQLLEDAKENAGLLRATLSKTAAANTGITLEELNTILRFKAGLESSLASKALYLSSESRPRLDNLLRGQAWADMQDTCNIIVQAYSAGGWNLDSKHVFARVSLIVEALANISQQELQICQQHIDDLSANAKWKQNLLSGIVIAAMLVIAILVVLFIRSIHQPIAQMISYAERVAKGDLDTPAPQNMRHELGALCTAWSSVLGKLKTLLHESANTTKLAQDESQKARIAMQEAEAAKAQAERAKAEGMHAAAEHLEGIAQAVSSAVESLRHHTVRTAQDADHQAERLSETSTAMEEMNSTVLEVARSAGQTSDVSAATKEKATHGAHVAQMAINSIQGVRDLSEQLKQDMNRLDENARNITNVMAVISEIADQTNLLALNAAIEAARAGDAGRGFAVVADEVRKLAEKTMASTNEVGHTITAIQHSTSESSKQVDLAVHAVEEATHLVNQSGEALQEIVNLAEETAGQVHSIAAAAEEQSATSEEITRSITDVNELSQGVCSSMQEADNVVQDVSLQAEKLLTLIQQMKQQ